MENNVKETGKIKAVALDFDGVITNLDIDWNTAIRRASQIAGYDVKSLLTFYEKCFGTPIFQTVSSEMEKIESEASNKAQVQPALKEFLQKISEKKIDAYVVSMQSRSVVEGFLNQHGLAGFFKGVITRERCPSKKGQVACVIKESGKNAKQVLFIDDSKGNINVCKELDVACFHFHRNQNPNVSKKEWNKVLTLIDGEVRQSRLGWLRSGSAT